MSVGWFAFPASAWAETADALVAAGVVWSEGQRVADLRWFDNEVRVKRLTLDDVPGARKMAERWKCGHWVARSLIRDSSRWADPTHPPHIYHTPITHPGKVESEQSADDHTPTTHQPHTHHTAQPNSVDKSARKEALTSNQEPLNQELEVVPSVVLPVQTSLVQSPQADDMLPPAVPSKKGKAPKQLRPDVVEAYEAYRSACGVSKTRDLDATKGQGAKLLSIQEQIPNDVVPLFEWMAKSPHHQAVFWRSKALSAINVSRHIDTLLDLMSIKTPAGGRPAVKADHSARTPAHDWHDAVKAARGQHPAWLDHIAPEARPRFERANARCRGFVLLRDMGAHPLDVKRVYEQFNQAFGEVA